MKRDEESSSDSECKQAITFPPPRGLPGQARTLQAIARPFITTPHSIISTRLLAGLGG